MGQPNLETSEYVGYWLNTMATKSSAGIAVDVTGNSTTTTYHSVTRFVTGDGRWHFFEWNLNDSSQWDRGTNAPAGALPVTMDSIWFYAPSNSPNTTIYLDDVYVIDVNAGP